MEGLNFIAMPSQEAADALNEEYEYYDEEDDGEAAVKSGGVTEGKSRKGANKSNKSKKKSK